MKLPKITAKQEGGDDGYCYVVRINGKEFVNGLTRSEVPYYRDRATQKYIRENIANQDVNCFLEAYFPQHWQQEQEIRDLAIDMLAEVAVKIDMEQQTAKS